MLVAKVLFFFNGPPLGNEILAFMEGGREGEGLLHLGRPLQGVHL